MPEILAHLDTGELRRVRDDDLRWYVETVHAFGGDPSRERGWGCECGDGELGVLPEVHDPACWVGGDIWTFPVGMGAHHGKV